MNPRFTWILLAITGSLFALIVLIERPHRVARNQPPDTRIFPNLRLSAVTGLQIHPAGQFEIRTERTNGLWHLVRPVNYPADSAKVESLLRAIADLRWDAHITSSELRERPRIQEQFGFDVPQFSVVLQQGEASRHLLIGKEVLGDQVYLQIVGGDGVYISGTRLLQLLPRQSAEWREAAALPHAIAEATAIEVRSAGKNFLRFETNPTNQTWRMTRPLDARANSARIQDLLSNLLALRVAGFISDDANADFDKFGLPNTSAEPAELEVTFFKGTNLVDGLQAGNVSSNSLHIHARRLNQPTVFLLSKESLDGWRAPLNEFRDRRLIELPVAVITNLQVAGEGEFTLTRPTNGLWQVANASPIEDQFVLDQEAVNEFLLILSRIEVGFENDVVVDFEPFGLANPTNAPFQCRVLGAFTNASPGTSAAGESLTFGLATTNRVYVRRGGEDRVYSVNLQEFELLPRALWHLRDRRIWSFKSTDVVRLTIHQNGKSRTLLRDGAEEWSLAPGSQGDVNPGLLEEAMHRLGEMKVIAWTAKGETDRTKFGFQEAGHGLSIDVKTNEGTNILEIEFGGFSPYYQPYGAVQLHGRRMVFEFPLQLYLDFIRRDLSILPRPLPGT